MVEIEQSSTEVGEAADYQAPWNSLTEVRGFGQTSEKRDLLFGVLDVGELCRTPLVSIAEKDSSNSSDSQGMLPQFDVQVSTPTLQCGVCGDAKNARFELSILSRDTGWGHAMVGISASEEGTEVYGFYGDPAGLSSRESSPGAVQNSNDVQDSAIFVFGTKGDLQAEDASSTGDTNKSVSLPITLKQCEAFFQTVQAWKSSPYKVVSRDCVSFVKASLEAIGVDAPSRVFTPTPAGFVGNLAKRFGTSGPKCLGPSSTSSTRLRP